MALAQSGAAKRPGVAPDARHISQGGSPKKPQETKTPRRIEPLAEAARHRAPGQRTHAPRSGARRPRAGACRWLAALDLPQQQRSGPRRCLPTASLWGEFVQGAVAVTRGWGPWGTGPRGPLCPACHRGHLFEWPGSGSDPSARGPRNQSDSEVALRPSPRSALDSCPRFAARSAVRRSGLPRCIAAAEGFLS